MKRSAMSLGAVGLFAAGASAGINFSIDVSNIISPDEPWATVEVWAHFDQEQYAFAGADFTVRTEADSGGLAVPQTVLTAQGTRDGDMSPDSDSVTYIIAGQLQFPLGGYFADSSNPILVWRAKWTTWDFSPRLVDITTSTEKFFLYLDEEGTSADFLDLSFVEGASVIQVVPAPGTVAGLFVTFAATARRARRRA